MLMVKAFRIFSAYCIFLIICSCSLYGARFKNPQVTIPESWHTQDKFTLAESSMDLTTLAWWTKFNDSSLNNLVESALKYNNSLQIAIGNIIQAEGYLKQVNLSFVPQINGQIAYTATQNLSGVGAVSTPGGGVSLLNQGGGSGGFSMSIIPTYSLNFMQQIYAKKAATASLNAQIYAKDMARLSIISQVVSNYFALLAFKEELNLQQEIVKDSYKLLQINQKEYDEGFISLQDLQGAVQNYTQTLAVIPILQNNIVNINNVIRILINQNPGDIKVGSSFSSLPVTDMIPSNLPSQVLMNRPDIKEALEELKIANANISEAKSTFFPTISLTGTLGATSSSLNRLFSNGNDFWQTQISSVMPFLNLSALGEIKSSKGKYYSAYYNYILAVRTAFAQVDSALSSHDKITSALLIKDNNIKSLALSYKLQLEKYKLGSVSYMSLLIYKINLNNALISFNQLKLQQLQAIINLYQSIASGYNVNNYEVAHEPFKGIL